MLNQTQPNANCAHFNIKLLGHQSKYTYIVARVRRRSFVPPPHQTVLCFTKLPNLKIILFFLHWSSYYFINKLVFIIDLRIYYYCFISFKENKKLNFKTKALCILIIMLNLFFNGIVSSTICITLIKPLYLFFRYSILKSIILWLQNPGRRRDAREIMLDFLALIVFTPMAFFGTYMALLTAETW